MTLIVILLVTAALDAEAYEDPRAGDPGRAARGLVVRRALAGTLFL